jgi:hypothetical protein
MPSYTPATVISLPRLTAAGATALGEKLLTAAKAHQTNLTSGVAKVLGQLTQAHAGLKKALSDQVPPSVPQGPESDAPACDRRVDACWSGLLDFLTAYSKLPDVPQAAEAASLKANIYPDGLKFLLLTYELEWAEGESRLSRIQAQGLDQRITALGGGLFLQALSAAHDAYGKALGLTQAPAAPAPEPPSVREALDAFAATLRKYVTKVMGAVDDDEPATQALADDLLAPLATWDVGPSGGKGPGAPEEPKGGPGGEK